MALPVTAGGGVIGLLVLLASVLLGGGGGGGSGGAGVDLGRVLQSDLGAPGPETEQDQFVAFLTEDIQAVWADVFTQQGRTYRYADVVSFEDQVSTGCGAATSAVGPFYCPADKFVYFDLDFLTQLQNQFGATGDLAAQYIVAHEYGHHVQNLTGVSDQVHQAQQSNPGQANAYSVALELQADCFAGAWAHDAAARGQLEKGEIDEALNAAAAVGDDRIQQQTQGRVDEESWTHGSSEQRVQWFRRGYETGDPQRCTTFEEL
jgi:uncharacterized protein